MSQAVEIIGTLGSASVSTTLSGNQMPPPDPAFGGVITTPALDRVAKTGLRYTNFHSTSLCSSTRAAIITGRNHHSIGFGVVGEIAKITNDTSGYCRFEQRVKALSC